MIVPSERQRHRPKNDILDRYQVCHRSLQAQPIDYLVALSFTNCQDRLSARPGDFMRSGAGEILIYGNFHEIGCRYRDR